MRKFLIALATWLWASAALANVPCTLPFNLQNGNTADATQVMANYNALVTCLQSAAAAGINSDITALLGLTTPLSPSSGGSTVFIGGTSSGSVNAQTISTSSSFTLTTGYSVVFIAGYANTGPLTLSVNGLTVASTTSPTCSSGTCPPSFYRQTPAGPQPMTGQEIQPLQIVIAQWDGTYFELVDPTAQFGGFGATTVLASGSTTDLGTVASHNVSISGTTTINSFGQTAVTTYPVYRLYFQSALTITYNQTNCSTTGGCINTPAAVSIPVQAGDTAVAYFLGTGSSGAGNWLITGYQRANGSALTTPTPLCGASGLKIINDAGTPNTLVDVTASSAITLNGSGISQFRTGISLALNTTNGNSTSTANGMDGENRPTSNWLYIYLIDNGSAAASLGSTSSTTPTLPIGYAYSCRIGTMRTDGSANIERTIQLGKHVQYVVGTNPAVAPNIANGTAGTFSLTSPTLTTASITGFVPPTAATISILATSEYGGNGGSAIEIAPNTSWGGTNNGPQGSNGQLWPFHSVGLAGTVSATFTMGLETSSIAWASSGAGAAISALGWDDQVNAN